jgi:hypothetical protein
MAHVLLTLLPYIYLCNVSTWLSSQLSSYFPFQFLFMQFVNYYIHFGYFFIQRLSYSWWESYLPCVYYLFAIRPCYPISTSILAYLLYVCVLSSQHILLRERFHVLFYFLIPWTEFLTIIFIFLLRVTSLIRENHVDDSRTSWSLKPVEDWVSWLQNLGLV